MLEALWHSLPRRPTSPTPAYTSSLTLSRPLTTREELAVPAGVLGMGDGCSHAEAGQAGQGAVGQVAGQAGPASLSECRGKKNGPAYPVSRGLSASGGGTWQAPLAVPTSKGLPDPLTCSAAAGKG